MFQAVLQDKEVSSVEPRPRPKALHRQQLAWEERRRWQSERCSAHPRLSLTLFLFH